MRSGLAPAAWWGSRHRIGDSASHLLRESTLPVVDESDTVIKQLPIINGAEGVNVRHQGPNEALAVDRNGQRWIIWKTADFILEARPADD